MKFKETVHNLREAVRTNNLAALKEVVVPGAFVDTIRNPYTNSTLLAEAVLSNSTEMAITLAKAGADPTAENNFGLTPIDYAENLNNPELLEALKNPEKLRRLGNTPSSHSIQRRQTETPRDPGFTTNRKNRKGMSF